VVFLPVDLQGSVEVPYLIAQALLYSCIVYWCANLPAARNEQETPGPI
jgi:hypothetical protein